MQQPLYKLIGDIMNRVEKIFNAILVVIIAGVLLGAFGVQVFKHEQPCPLCLLQRLAMIGLAIGALMNCKFGPSKAHYALSLISCIFGSFVSMRQFFLHVCPDFPTFGHPFWGLSLYTWAFLVFATSVAYISVLLLVFNKSRLDEERQHLNWFCQVAFAMLFLVAAGNVGWALYACQLGPCQG